MADAGALVPIFGLDLPRPPAPYEMQCQLFRACLLEVVQMTAVQAARLATNGCNTAEDVAMLDTDTLMGIPLETTPAMIKMRLKTLKTWIDTAFDSVVGQPSGTMYVSDFTADICRDLQRKLSRKMGVTFAKAASSADTKDGIGSFNGKLGTWKRAKRKFEAGLAQFKNENGVPLSYVIRDDSERDATVATGGYAATLYDPPFIGPTFVADNFRVYQLLIQWTSGGTAETYVDRYQSTQHGRQVWLSLVGTYDGPDARNASVQETRLLLDALKYEKDSHNYTFDDYCTKTITYNNDLTRHMANVDGRSQVSKFLNGITRADMQPIKVSIMRDINCKDDLFKSVSEFKDVYQTLLRTTGAGQTRAERRIGSQTSTQATRGGGGRGGRGHGGRHQGRGERGSAGRFSRGRGGRGGGGGGGGRNRQGGSNYRTGNFISQATLNLLTPRERAMMMAGRASFEAEEDSTSSTRSVAAATAAIAAEPASNPTTVVIAAPRTGTGASGMFGQQGNGNTRNASSTTSNSSSVTNGNQYYIDHDNVRRLCLVTLTSSIRFVGSQIIFQQPTDYLARKRCEIDTRADTFCAGMTFSFQEPTGSVVDVGGFHPSLPILKDIPIGLVATAYDLPTGETIILGVHQALYFGVSLEHSLCQPNQLREHGIIVDDCPKQYSGGKSLHGLFFPDDGVHIPMEMHGCLSYFPSRLPTNTELETCRWVYMSGEGEWDPYSEHFAAAESATRSHLVEHPRYAPPTQSTYDAAGAILDGRFIGAVARHEAAVAESSIFATDSMDMLIGSIPLESTTAGNRYIGATSSRTHRSSVDAAELARRWGTSLSTAETTLKTTTQRGYRYLQGSLDRRFRTRQNQLRRNLLRTAVYSDTLFSDTKSIRGMTCAQLFVTSEGFADGNVMTTKSDAYVQLNHFCRAHGIPDPLVTDMAPEETEGEWKRVVNGKTSVRMKLVNSSATA